MNRSLGFSAWLILLGVGHIAHAKPTWVLTTTDFGQKQVTVESLGAESRLKSGQDEIKLKLDDILELRRAGSTKPVGLVLQMIGGDELVGTPVRLTAESIVMNAGPLGEVEVALSRVAGLVRDRATTIDPTQKRTEDTIRLANGDTVTGILSDFDAGSISIQKSDGATTQIPLESVQSVLFAQTAQPASAEAGPSRGAQFRVSLANGSRVTATNLGIKDETLSLQPVGGKSVSVAEDAVLGIERLNGPVVWLSTRTPLESLHIPYLDGAFPARMDQSVVGGAIRFGTQSFSRGIGVHARSRITFSIQPGDHTFRTRYATDGQLGYADMDVRILVDDKVVHEALSFKSGTIGEVKDIPIKDGKTLTLEVDFGAGYDVQDRLNWIEPAILRQ